MKNKTHINRARLGLCIDCGNTKDISNLRCKICLKKQRTNDLKFCYGKEAVLPQDNDVCSICGLRNKKCRIGIDHDHKTKQIRGYLCLKCNRGIGFFNDNPSLLQAAKEYLMVS